MPNHSSGNEITSTAAMKEFGLENSVLGIDVGASLFRVLNDQRKKLSALATKRGSSGC